VDNRSTGGLSLPPHWRCKEERYFTRSRRLMKKPRVGAGSLITYRFVTKTSGNLACMGGRPRNPSAGSSASPVHIPLKF
jgi:hypothetical protein